MYEPLASFVTRTLTGVVTAAPGDAWARTTTSAPPRIAKRSFRTAPSLMNHPRRAAELSLKTCHKTGPRASPVLGCLAHEVGHRPGLRGMAEPPHPQQVLDGRQQ